MAEIYQSSIFPYEESHHYALHLNTHALSELRTPVHSRAQLIWEALIWPYKLLGRHRTPVINWVSSFRQSTGIEKSCHCHIAMHYLYHGGISKFQ